MGKLRLELLLLLLSHSCGTDGRPGKSTPARTTSPMQSKEVVVANVADAGIVVIGGFGAHPLVRPVDSLRVPLPRATPVEISRWRVPPRRERLAEGLNEHRSPKSQRNGSPSRPDAGPARLRSAQKRGAIRWLATSPARLPTPLAVGCDGGNRPGHIGFPALRSRRNMGRTLRASHQRR